MTQLSEQPSEITRDQMIMEWHASQEMLRELKEREMNLRKQLVDCDMFTAEKEGTQNYELGNSYKLKAVIKKNYALVKDEEVLNSTLTELEDYIVADVIKWTPNFDENLFKVLTAAEQSIVRKAIKSWSASLDKKAYLNMDTINQKIMSKAVVSTFGAPTLTLVEPKAKDVVPTLKQ